VCCGVQISNDGVDAAVQRITLEALAAAVVGMYPSDCDMLAVKAVDFTAVVATKETRRELMQTETTFLKATLSLLGGRRFMNFSKQNDWLFLCNANSTRTGQTERESTSAHLVGPLWE
jgi:hypothetical protein